MDDLFDVLNTAFSDPDCEAHALAELAALQQGSQLFNDFLVDFQQLQAKTNTLEKQQIHELHNKLSHELRDQLVDGNPLPRTLSTLIERCQRLDRQLQEVAT